MFPTSTESFGPNQDVHGSAYKGHISEQDLQKLEDSIVNASSDPFSILHTICDRFGIAPKSTSIDTQTPSNPSLFSHLLSALFTVGYSLLITSFFLLPLSSIQSSSSQYLPNTVNFQLLPLFTTILQRHPLSLPNFLSSPLWLSLPSTLIASPQSPSTLQTQPQPSPPNEPQREEQSHLRPVLSFINSTLLLCLSSSPPTPIPNKTLLSSSLSTFSSHPDPLVKVHSGSALLTLNQLDGGTDETSMSVDELVAQRDTLRAQIEEKNEEIARLMEIQRQMDETIRSRDQIIAEKDDSLKQKDFMLTQQATTIAELTKMLGEFESMEKRLNDELGKTHSKMVAVEAQLTEAAKDVKWIRGFAHSDNAITVWDPKHFRREGRRITSLVMDYKSCFSDEITRGMWRLSIRCNKYDLHTFGVIVSSYLDGSKIASLREKPWSSVFHLHDGSVHQNGKPIAFGNQKPKDNSIVTLELDMNRHTLDLFVDDQRQPHSLTSIPQKVRFALYVFEKDRSVEILSFDEISARI